LDRLTVPSDSIVWRPRRRPRTEARARRRDDHSGRLDITGPITEERVLINADIGRMSALGANRTRREGRNDVNDPLPTLAQSKSRTCNGLLPAPTTMAVIRCMAGSGSRKAWNASRDEPRSRLHQKEQAAAREEPPPSRWFWWWTTSDWLRPSDRTCRLRRTSRCTNWSRAQPD